MIPLFSVSLQQKTEYMLCFVCTQRTRRRHFRHKLRSYSEFVSFISSLFAQRWIMPVDCALLIQFALLLVCDCEFRFNGHFSVHLEWCGRSRRTTFYLISLCPFACRMHSNKMEKWKPKHINNYGGERERRENGNFSFLVVLPLSTFFFVHNYLLFTFTINNKWMETMKKNICKTIFHLINSCRCFFFFSLLRPVSIPHSLRSCLIVVSCLGGSNSGRRNDALETQNAIMMILLAKRVKKNEWKLILVSCRPESRCMWRTARCSLFSSYNIANVRHCATTNFISDSCDNRATKRNWIEWTSDGVCMYAKERETWCVIVVNVVQNDHFE